MRTCASARRCSVPHPFLVVREFQHGDRYPYLPYPTAHAKQTWAVKKVVVNGDPLPVPFEICHYQGDPSESWLPSKEVMLVNYHFGVIEKLNSLNFKCKINSQTFRK